MKKRCALYIRESEIEKWPEIQARDLKAFVLERELEIEKIYHDYGVGPMEDRPQLEDLMKGARSNRFDFVATWRLDRMFVSHQHMVSVTRELQALGIGFVSVQEKIDLTSQDTELLNHLFQVFANFQGRIMAERAQAGINGQRRKGMVFGRDRKIDRKKALELSDQGLKHAEIARRLSCSQGGLSKVLRECKMRQSLGVAL